MDSTFAARVREHHIGPCRVLVLPTPVQEVVTWRLSFETFPDFAMGEALLQEMTVSMLDRGTTSRDRFAFAEVFEERGARIHFESKGWRVGVSGKALRAHIPDVFAVMAEALREPLFDADEFAKVQAQQAAALHRSMENTSAQASSALSRHLYPASHPNYTEAAAVQLDQLASLTVDQLAAYHARHFAARALQLVVVGDVDEAALLEAVQANLADWPEGDAGLGLSITPKDAAPGRSAIPMPDKQNVDVRLGHGVDVRRDDDVYLPLYVGNYILGGNFSARLMNTIRDEMGLTYGIRSMLSGVTIEHGGHWGVGVTLSQENLMRGIEATRAEVERFVKEGVTAEELAEKQTTITGLFKVQLATTGGLATALLNNAERGFDTAYLDEFPGDVSSLGLDEVNAAIQAHLDPERFHLALAGTLPDEDAD